MSRSTALYRLYDANDRLLYIGIAENVEKRWASHESTKAWWPHVVRRTVEWFDTRELALEAEAHAIRTERAVYNVAGSPWAPKPRALHENETLVGPLKKRFLCTIDHIATSGDAVFIVDRTRDRKPQAVLVPVEFYERAQQALGARE